MFLLSLLRLRVSPGIPVRMPRAARVTTGTVGVTPRRSGRTRAFVNYADESIAEKRKESMDPDTESPLTELESEGSAEPPPKKKRGRRVKVTEPVVYHIPPVETKTTTFKGTSDSKLVYGLNFTDNRCLGRLGYVRSACSGSFPFSLTVPQGLPEHYPPHYEAGSYIL